MSYVQSGEATFDVADRPDSSATGTATVGLAKSSGSPRVVPGGNDDPNGDDDVAGFAFGAPSDRRKWDSIESVSHCGECGEETGNGLSLTEEHDFESTCSECGNVLSF